MVGMHPRARAGLAFVAILGGAAVYAAQEAVGATCAPRLPCAEAVGWVRGILGTLALAMLCAGALALAWVVPEDARTKPRLLWTLTFATLAGVWGLLLAPVFGQGLADAVLLVLVAIAALVVGCVARLVLLAPPGSPARERSLRIALAVLALLVLLQPLSILRWWSTAPAGLDWGIEGGHLCGIRAFANGTTGWCAPMAQVAGAPPLLLAAAATLAHVARPAWRWSRCLALACMGSALVVVVAFDRLQGGSAPLLLGGIATLGVASWLLERGAHAREAACHPRG